MANGLFGDVQVTYFKQRRVMEHKKNLTMERLAQEGAVGIPVDESKPPS